MNDEPEEMDQFESLDRSSSNSASNERTRQIGVFKGSIKRGEVRNPYGRPRKTWTARELFEQKVRKDLKAAAKDFGAEALTTIVNIMRDENVSAQHRLSAAAQILDRGFGKPKNETEITVGVYEKLSSEELIKFITGKEIEGEVIESNEHEPRTVDDQEGIDEDYQSNEDDESGAMDDES
jgi:hypothetical protein